MSFRIAFQMDALARLDKIYDATLDLARVVAAQGHELFHYEPQQLRMDIAKDAVRVTARGHVLLFKPENEDPWSLGEESVRDLAGFDVILMRQDPPFDLAYVTATHILEHLKGKTRVVNDPVGVRNAPEKLLVTHFPHLMPPTLISRDRAAIEAFRAEHGDIIIKPLFGYASRGIFHLAAQDNNLPSLIEMLAASSNEPWVTQKFMPVATLGDKRIILLDGKPAGAFLRIPVKGDIRGSVRPAVGAHVMKTDLTKRDREICETLAPVLRKEGLFLAGIDIIGDYVTEINVTSPSGLVQADRLEGHTGKERIAERFWQQLLA